MKGRFKVGDHVSWNSEAGRVSGRMVKIHTRDVDYEGHTHYASSDEQSSAHVDLFLPFAEFAKLQLC